MIRTNLTAAHGGNTNQTITARGGTNQNTNCMKTALMKRPAPAAAAAAQRKSFVQLFYRQLLLGVFILLGLVGQSWGQTNLAAWTFDATAASPSTPTSVAANLGTQSGVATLYADGSNGSSVWLPATELNAFAGTTVNDPRGTPVAGFSYCPLGGTSNSANGKNMVLKFSMTGFENPILTFATRGTSTGFSTHQWAWSTDNITYTNFGSNTANTTSTFTTMTLDMSAINAVDGAATVYLRITFTGATSASGNNRLDNIKINATVPCIAPSITSATAAADPICSNATTTLTANGVAGTNATVTWWTGTGGTGTPVGTGNVSNPVGPGTYYAYVTGDCLPAAEASVTVTGQAPPNAGIDGNLTICAGSTVTAPQLFAALTGSPDAGGSWSPALAGAGVYTYTVNAIAPCTGTDVSTVTVTEQAQPNAGIDVNLTI